MRETLFKKIDYTLSLLIQNIDHGQIGLPDIQRPFVWTSAKVRDLFDSMYKGFPVGYLLFWANDHFRGTKVIGTDKKQRRVPGLLIVDGQQRLTSLYAVLKGKPVVTKDFKKEHIQIAFRPSDGRFEVADAATERDPEFIPDISKLWAGVLGEHRFIKAFLAHLGQSRDLSAADEDKISEAIDRLYDVQNYPFTAMEIPPSASEEQVADIFVRINSKGTPLNQADFILTLLSVFWDEGRAELERFSRQSRHPSPDAKPSPYNHFIQPDPDQLLRVSVALGFRRARLQYVYSILRGKDLETGEFSDKRRTAQFEVLQRAQEHVLNLTHWHDFMKVLVRAGFRSTNMVSSKTGLLYTYALYLIGRTDYQMPDDTLRDVCARWFFMQALTGRYSASPESTMDGDLARLRGLETPDQFLATLNRIIEDTLTNDFWNITLPNAMETAAARSPYFFGYCAALSLLDAPVLFSDMKVSQLLDPALREKRKALERHHLFPRKHLLSLGINGNRQINQIANYALVEWGHNAEISDSPPAKYYPELATGENFAPEKLAFMCEMHALPDGWYEMDYEEFLPERRKRMAAVTRKGFAALANS